MEDINLGFVCGLIVALVIFAGQYHYTDMVNYIHVSDCPQERFVLDCAPELVEVYIADHPGVCDGLCVDADWSTYFKDRYALNATIYYSNGSIYRTQNRTENMTYYEESIDWSVLQ